MDAGLKPENILTMSISLPPAKYPTSEAANIFHHQLLERVSSLPGVQTAGLINYLPLQQWGINGDVSFENDPPYPPGQGPHAEFRTVGGDYFQALGIPLIAGRFFDEHDQQSSAQVVLVNQALANQFLPTKDAIGSHLLDNNNRPSITIIGVVGDVHQSGLTQPAKPEIYFPYQQAAEVVKRSMSLVIRAQGDPTSLVATVRG